MAGDWAKRAPLLGVVAIVLFIIAFAVGGDTPDADDTAAQAVQFYKDHDSDQIWAAALLTWASVFLVFFAGALRSALRRTEGDTGGLSTVSFAGAVIMAIGFALFAGIGFTLGDVADKLDASAVQALNALNSDLFLPLAMGTGLFMLSTGIAIVRGGALPGWFGWIAVVIGIAALTPGGFFALLLTGIWILIASVLLYRRTPAAA